MRRLDGKVAIVTGAAGGIGFATARRLSEEGARVCLAGRKRDELDRRAAEICQGAFVAVCDVADEGQVQSCIERAVGEGGKLDIIVNNAGIMLFKPIVELTRADWDHVLGVDLYGAVNFLRHGLPVLGRGGAVVNVTSIHGHQTSALVAPYAAAKAAVESLTRSAAIEAKPMGVRVNAVAPGAVETPMLRENPNVRSGAEKIDPADVGRPEDIAATVAFLASDDAAFVTGAVLWADGGRSGRL